MKEWIEKNHKDKQIPLPSPKKKTKKKTKKLCYIAAP